MSEVVYRSRVAVERRRGLLRYATLPAEQQPVAFGVHDEIAAHYKAAEGEFEPHASTIDYLVAAASG